MPKKRFTDEQIAFALRQAEAGTTIGEICRKMGIAEATFYRWKKIYAGMGVAEIRRLKQLEEENGKLKRLVADLTLDKTMLQGERAARHRFERKRERCAESGEARPSPRGRPAFPGGLRCLGTQGMPGQRLRAGFPAIPVAPRPAAAAEGADEGVGGDAGALRLSAHPRAAATGGLEDQPQAPLPALQRGRAVDPHPKPEEASGVPVPGRSP